MRVVKWLTCVAAIALLTGCDDPAREGSGASDVDDDPNSAAVTGALVGMGVPEYEANSDETRRAKDIFESAGAEHIATAGEAKVSDKDRGTDYQKAA